MAFKKYCLDCKERFQPPTRFTRYCEKCKCKRHSNSHKINRKELIKKYDLLKKELELIRSDMTLKKYKILIKAYKIGKKIYGHNYSYFRLSFDFEIPYTTVKRVCSLEKANFNTWKLINKKKISSFKVAQIINQHGSTYQDELIKLTIDNELSTYEIRELRVRSLDDIKKLRLKIAVNRGFAREHAALKSFMDTIDRMATLMTIEQEKLPSNQLLKLKKKIETLIKKMEQFNRRISTKCSIAKLEGKR